MRENKSNFPLLNLGKLMGEISVASLNNIYRCLEDLNVLKLFNKYWIKSPPQLTKVGLAVLKEYSVVVH